MKTINKNNTIVEFDRNKIIDTMESNSNSSVESADTTLDTDWVPFLSHICGWMDNNTEFLISCDQRFILPCINGHPLRFLCLFDSYDDKLKLETNLFYASKHNGILETERLKEIPKFAYINLMGRNS